MYAPKVPVMSEDVAKLNAPCRFARRELSVAAAPLRDGHMRAASPPTKLRNSRTIRPVCKSPIRLNLQDPLVAVPVRPFSWTRAHYPRIGGPTITIPWLAARNSISLADTLATPRARTSNSAFACAVMDMISSDFRTGCVFQRMGASK